MPMCTPATHTSVLPYWLQTREEDDLRIRCGQIPDFSCNPGFGAPLMRSDVEIIQGWNEEQRSWGLQARLHLDRNGQPQVVEILGPDLCAPFALAYRLADGGVQVDGWAGDSYRCATLMAALELVETTF